MNCDKLISPSVSHQVTYKLDTLKGVSTNYAQCDMVCLFMCSSVVTQTVGKCQGDIFPKDADSLTEVGSSLHESAESKKTELKTLITKENKHNNSVNTDAWRIDAFMGGRFRRRKITGKASDMAENLQL